MTDEAKVLAPLRRANDMARQPRRLGVLAASEFCERFAFFGVQAVLLLYLSEALLRLGALSDHVLGLTFLNDAVEALAHPTTPVQTASLLVGLFGGLAYLAPIAGGWVADRLLGQRRTIIAGALLMSAGYGLLIAERYFLIGLGLVIAGSGGFKGNIASEVSALYRDEDPRREQGFRLFFIAVNLGIVGAPVICGALAQSYGWKFGFAGSAVSMLVSALIYLARSRGETQPPAPACYLGPHAGGRALSAQQALAFGAFMSLVAVALVGAEQIYNAYLGWMHYEVAPTLFGHPFPTQWMVTLDTAFSLLMLGLANAMWRFWRRRWREPSELTKIAIGCAVVAGSYSCLALVRGASSPANMALILSFHLLNNLGYANVAPVALALIARRAPVRVRSTLIGLFYMQFAGGTFLAGALGRLLDAIPSSSFWLLHAGVVGGAGAMLLASSGWIDRFMDGAAPPSVDSAEILPDAGRMAHSSHLRPRVV